MQKPNTKVQAGGFAGGLALLIVWGLGQCGVTVPPEAAAAIATVLSFAVAYFVPEKKA